MVRHWRTIIFELADGTPCPGRETGSALPRLVELRRWDVRRWTLGPGARGVYDHCETENGMLWMWVQREMGEKKKWPAPIF